MSSFTAASETETREWVTASGITYCLLKPGLSTANEIFDRRGNNIKKGMKRRKIVALVMTFEP